MAEVQELARADGETIAYLRRDGKTPGVIWCGGLKSDMTGTKANHIDAWAQRQGRAFVRFDYLGHGASSGDFRSGTISRWRDDTLAVLDGLTSGPQILIGSSMGAWVALLAALVRPDRVKGLLLIAPAPDFTEALIWAEMTPEIRRRVMEEGEWERPSEYGETPYPITRALIEDGRRNLLLRRAIPLSLPIRILQGMKDVDVPWKHALDLAERLEGNPSLTLIKHGDHRLSTPADLRRMEEALDGLLGEV